MQLNIVAISCFTLELTLSSIGVKGYFGSFFFWLDLLSTISILADIAPIWEGFISLFTSKDQLTSDISSLMEMQGIQQHRDLFLNAIGSYANVVNT